MGIKAFYSYFHSTANNISTKTDQLITCIQLFTQIVAFNYELLCLKIFILLACPNLTCAPITNCCSTNPIQVSRGQSTKAMFTF